MNIIEARPQLYLIGLEQQMEGFVTFIGSWASVGDFNFLVDVGPKASIGQLVEGLKALGIKGVDFIFLTHIHIDHAGGTGALIQQFPEARVICHPSGIKHLIDPKKIWEASKKSLGEIALKYGEIDPVPEENIFPSSECELKGFQLINTPGHAPHHISLLHKKYLFVGDAVGVFRNVDGLLYLRPSLQPKFDLEETMISVDRLLKSDGEEICYAHFGIHSDAKGMLRRYKNQLFLWRDVISEQSKYFEGEELIDRCVTVLLEKDESLGSFSDLGKGERKREIDSIKMGIQLFLEYLASGNLR